jgi:hypothetical protein
LGSKNIDRHLSDNVWCQVLPVVLSKNFSIQGVSDTRRLSEANDLPCPPLEKFPHPGSCSWTRRALEEVYNVVPENLVVKVSIHRTPRGNVRKCESDLQNRISTSNLEAGIDAYLTDCVRNRARSHLPHTYDGGNTRLHFGLI